MDLKIDAGSYNGIGLDHVGCYGGYCIVQYHPEGTISHPFGARRRRKAEMVSFLNGLIDGITFIKTKALDD